MLKKQELTGILGEWLSNETEQSVGRTNIELEFKKITERACSNNEFISPDQTTQPLPLNPQIIDPVKK